eukprot:gene11878-8164_t
MDDDCPPREGGVDVVKKGLQRPSGSSAASRQRHRTPARLGGSAGTNNGNVRPPPRSGGGPSPSIDASAKAEEQHWLHRLWERYCGPLTGAEMGGLQVESPEVNALWSLWGPLLRRLPLYRRRRPTALGEEDDDDDDDVVVVEEEASQRGQLGSAPLRKRPRSPTAVSCAADGQVSYPPPVPEAPTHIFFLPLHISSASAAGSSSHSSACASQEQCQGPALLHEGMRKGLLQHPRVLLPLLTFFYSWMLYKGDTEMRIVRHDGSGGVSRSLVALHHHQEEEEEQQQQQQQQQAQQVARLMRRQRSAACEGLLFCCLVPPATLRASSTILSLLTPFAAVGAAQIGQLLTITGSVIRLSAPRVVCTGLQFICQLCGATRWARTEDGVLVYPGPCDGNQKPTKEDDAGGRSIPGPPRRRERCRGYKWAPVTQVSSCEEVQWLKLQESVSDDLLLLASPDGSGVGGVNKVLEVALRNPFLDRVAVGDTVMVCGVLQTKREAGGATRGSSGAGGAGLQLCVQAVSIAPYTREKEEESVEAAAEDDGITGSLGGALQHGKEFFGMLLQERPRSTSGRSGASSALGSGAALETLMSAAEKAQFFEAARHPHWFARLAASLAPGLFGLTMVKEALILAIIGGSGASSLSVSTSHASSTTGNTRSSSSSTVRHNIHVLLLGDPGLGKSQLLRAACRLASRSAYVCAHTSSSCGLTLTMSRDPLTGEASFEAGAVVHGDGGITGIDEIDKGTTEHKALLEVMEQETVSVAKAGVLFSMPVRTTVFAAGNPLGGSFAAGACAGASVAEASRMSPALLSRFDLVICLRDGPGQPCGEWPPDMQKGDEAYRSNHSAPSLTHHVLRMHRAAAAAAPADGSSNSSPAPLPLPLVQRFIAFARGTCHPRLLQEAAAVLKAHYLQRRAALAGGGGGGASGSVGAGAERLATPRYLQSLIRLAGARAKAELRGEITAADARYAVALLQACAGTVSRSPSCRANALDGSGGIGLVVDPSMAGGGSRCGGVTRKKPQREVVVALLKAALVQQYAEAGESGSHKLSREAGCKDPNAMLRQLNEYGLLLQAGDMFVLRGV